MKKLIILILITFLNLFNSFAGQIPGLKIIAKLKSTNLYENLFAFQNGNNFSIQLCQPNKYDTILIIPSDDNNSSANPIESQFSNGEYTDSLKIEIYNKRLIKGSCNNSYGTFTYKIDVFNYQSSVNDTIIQLPKCGEPLEISNSFSGGGYIYKWSLYSNFQYIDLNTSKLLINPYDYLKDTVYYFTVQDSSFKCSFSRKFILKPSISQLFKDSICMVTISNNRNLVIWPNNNFNVKKYKIYRQNYLTSNYEAVHIQSSDLMSEWIDTMSNPGSKIDRYKISIIDSCGYELLSDNIHTTILLSSNLGVNGTVNLSWNPYEGFKYDNFEIWRSIDGKTFNKLTSVANNTYSFIDNNPPVNGYYQIRITNPNGCSPNKRGYSYLTSNTVDKTGKSAGLLFLSNEILDVFPNPTSDILNVKASKIQASFGYICKIIDLQGRELFKTSITSINTEISLKSFGAKGLYILHILDANNVSIQTKQIVLE